MAQDAPRPPGLERHLSVKEVCARLGVGKTLVYELVAQGVVPHVRLGRRVLIPEEALLSILGASRRSAPPPQEEEAEKHANVRNERTALHSPGRLRPL